MRDRSNGAKFEYITQQLGYLLGCDLYDAYLEGRVSPDTCAACSSRMSKSPARHGTSISTLSTGCAPPSEKHARRGRKVAPLSFWLAALDFQPAGRPLERPLFCFRQNDNFCRGATLVAASAEYCRRRVDRWRFMNSDSIRKLFDEVRRGKLSPDVAVQRLRHLPFEDLGFAKVDHHRALRVGMPR